MAKRRRRGGSAQEIERIVSQNTGYTIVLYETWSGTSREDPAGDLELRAAYYNHGDPVPEDLPAAFEAGQPQQSWGYYEGLPGAFSDEILQTMREADREANQAMAEHDELAEDPSEDLGYYGRQRKELRQQYQEFLEAIETVAVDYDNKSAWRIIDRWRARQLRAEEREEVTA